MTNIKKAKQQKQQQKPIVKKTNNNNNNNNSNNKNGKKNDNNKKIINNNKINNSVNNNNKLKVIPNKSTVTNNKEEKKKEEIKIIEKEEQEDIELNEDDNEKYSLWNPKPINNNNTNNNNNNNKSKELKNNENILKGSRFRWLNELLYVSHSKDAFKEFSQDRSLFDQYHSGFKSQVESWPINPLDLIIDELKSIKQRKRIADLGCGEAKLAETLSKQHSVQSFDLVAVNERVTSCDISNLPLKDESIDIAVFCLSLMGTNFMDFLNEAKRVLVKNGILKIAEIESRITNIKIFIEEIEKLGFKLIKKNEKNEYFTLFEFSKNENNSSNNNNNNNKNNKKLKQIQRQQQQDSEPILKPCLYKKR